MGPSVPLFGVVREKRSASRSSVDSAEARDVKRRRGASLTVSSSFLQPLYHSDICLAIRQDLILRQGRMRAQIRRSRTGDPSGLTMMGLSLLEPVKLLV